MTQNINRAVLMIKGGSIFSLSMASLSVKKIGKAKIITKAVPVCISLTRSFKTEPESVKIVAAKTALRLSKRLFTDKKVTINPSPAIRALMAMI